MTLPIEIRLQIYAPLILEEPLRLYYSGVQRYTAHQSYHTHTLLFLNRSVRNEYKDELLRRGLIEVVIDRHNLSAKDSNRIRRDLGDPEGTVKGAGIQP